MTTKYSHIFFDLDKTIWDFETNSEQTIREIYDMLKFDKQNISSFDAFHKIYDGHNLRYWELYRQNKVEKADLMVMRFQDALLEFGIDDTEIAQQFSTKYLELLPEKTAVFEGTHETLEYLSAKYKLHIITNGFEEVQFRKIHNTGMDKFFTRIITSEEAGCKKPDQRIFEYSLKLIQASAHECLMVGDDMEVDLLGARHADIDQVFFNTKNIKHNHKFTYEIKDMRELCGLL